MIRFTKDKETLRGGLNDKFIVRRQLHSTNSWQISLGKELDDFYYKSLVMTPPFKVLYG